jgi:hypothetical protein
MCRSDRVLLADDGSITTVQEGIAQMEIGIKAQLAQNDRNGQSGENNQSSNDKTQDKNTHIESMMEKAKLDGPVYLGNEHNDNYVMQETVNRLQIQTNLFYVDQLEKLMISLGQIAKLKTQRKKAPVNKKPTIAKQAAAAMAKKKIATKTNGGKSTTTTATTTVQVSTESTESTESTPTAAEPTAATPPTPTPTPTTNNIDPKKTESNETTQTEIIIPKPNVFLFLQTENHVVDYRWLITDPSTPQNSPNLQNSTQPKLDRSLVCYFMSDVEFFQDVIPNHPHPGLKLKDLKPKLQKLLKENNPQEAVVTVALFGTHDIHVGRTSLPPYDGMLAQLEESNQFVGADCLEINIDR